MMDTWHSYGKVFPIGHRDVLDVFKDPVVVQEKVDGSYIGFGVYDGVLRVRSRSKEINIDDPEKLFIEGVEALKALKDVLNPNWMYHGEYLKKPKHNSLSYNRHPDNHIILFDVACGHEQFLGQKTLMAEGCRLGLETVPILFTGLVENMDQLEELLSTDSVLGGQKIEGVVCKNYSRTTKDGKSMKAKLVSQAFKEVHSQEWKNTNPTGKDILTRLGEKYRSKARWNKAIHRARENGTLQECYSDIGPLMKSVKEDVLQEESEAIKDHLLDWAISHILRKVTNGFPEFYKELLTSRQFSEREGS